MLTLKEKINPNLICLAIKRYTILSFSPHSISLPLSLSLLPSPASPTNHNKLTWSGGPVRTLSACSDRRGFLCASCHDSSSERIDSWASISASAEKLSKAAASPLRPDLGSHWAATALRFVCFRPPGEKNYPGAGGGADTTEAQLKAAPRRKRSQDNGPWDEKPSQCPAPSNHSKG